MPKNNRETVTLGDIARSQAASASSKVHTPDEVAELVNAPSPAKLAQLEADRSAFAKLAESETAAAIAHADKLEAGGDVFPGDVGDPGLTVGLADVAPTGDTAENGDTDRTDPHAG